MLKPLTSLLWYLREDSPVVDLTSEILPEIDCSAEIISKEKGIIAGLRESKELCSHLGLSFNQMTEDGEEVTPGEKVAIIEGNAKRILLVERTILNLLGRMSGIATITREIVERTNSVNPRVRIAATRKTCPGFSFFEKRAVEIGGGLTHRYSLSDGVLIKDNHVKILGLKEAIERAKKRFHPLRKIEIEVETIRDAIRAAELGADVLMLDNFSPAEVSKTISILKRRGLRDRVIIEVSGGVTKDNIEEYAKLDIDVISLGEITRSARILDFSLEIL